MERCAFHTPQGDIAYWVSRKGRPDRPWLIFLPGLTADHRLFEPQIAALEGKANLLVWDAPSHGASRPFELTWTLDDLARWLHGILEQEGIERPILVGQSMGGYTAQAFLDLFPGQAAGFISIDSAPLKRQYFHGWEIWALRHTRLMYLSIPWKTLVRLGSTGCATTPQGQALMREMMAGYGKVSASIAISQRTGIVPWQMQQPKDARTSSTARACSSAVKRTPQVRRATTTSAGPPRRTSTCIGLPAPVTTPIPTNPTR